MMISNEQARLAAQQLRKPPGLDSETDSRSVPQGVIDAAVEVASSTPDLREDRVAEARSRLEEGALDPREVAEKIISRIVSDSLR